MGRRKGHAASPGRAGLPDDLAAFDDLYLRHARAMLAFFSRRLFEPQAALDLTAETFAKALEGRHRIVDRGEEDASRWLYGIAHHELARYLRRGRCEQRALRRLGIQAPNAKPDELERIEELAVTADLRAAVRDAFRELPTPEREVLRLRIVDELPYGRVAAELDISEAAARMRVSRALRSLAARSELEVEDPA